MSKILPLQIDLSDEHLHKDKRNHRKILTEAKRNGYACLCATLNKKVEKTFCAKRITSTLFGFPIPCLVFTAFIIVAATAIIVWLSVMYVDVKEGKQSSYFTQCVSNNDCDVNIGLVCNTQNGICDCPAENTKGRCDCNTGYFWNGTNCLKLIKYNEYGCIGDYSCVKDKDLKCINQVCTCSAPKVWDSSAEICDYTFLGCYNESVALTAWSFRSQQSGNTYYFTDLCIDYCYKSDAKYAAVISTQNGTLNTCGCVNTIVTTRPLACDKLCAGLNGRYYYCGLSSGSTLNRAYYLLN